MAWKRNYLMLGALLVSTMLTSQGWGQNNTPGTFFERTPASADKLPLASPGLFDYDAQVFAPLEFTNGKEKEPNSGFYFSFDKTYSSIQRATRIDTVGNQSFNGSEFYWGSLYKGGWFNDDDTGWGIVYEENDGVFLTNGAVIQQGAFQQGTTLTVTSSDSVEINRLYRQQTSEGSYFEPYFGLRYLAIGDDALQDSPTNRFIQRATNRAVGLQVGSRFNRRFGRWRATYDGTVAATYNQQDLFTSDSAPSVEVNRSDQSFVPILDGSLEMAYNVSRDITLKFGVQGTYIWNGITRVNTQDAPLNGLSANGIGPEFVADDESYVTAGILFGVEWRR